MEAKRRIVIGAYLNGRHLHGNALIEHGSHSYRRMSVLSRKRLKAVREYEQDVKSRLVATVRRLWIWAVWNSYEAPFLANMPRVNDD